MRFWIREIAGWLLVLAGLYFFLASASLVLAQPSWVFSAIHTTVIGIFVFRGGIHLLKVATAARLASDPTPNKVSGPFTAATGRRSPHHDNF